MIAVACAILIAAATADSAATHLGLSTPVEVRDAGECLDGGTLVATLVDVSGRTVTLRLERGTSSSSYGRDQIGPSSWGQLFMRRNRGDEVGVGRGSGVASAAAVLIRAWIGTHYNAEEADVLANMTRSPRPSGAGFDLQASRAWHAVRFADSLCSYDAEVASVMDRRSTRSCETTLGMDLAELPGISKWLRAWCPGDTWQAAAFHYGGSQPLTSGPHYTVADSGVTYAGFPPEEARNWVLSPDRSHAVRFLPDVGSDGYPILEPDSYVALCEFGPGRHRRILFCGTPCDFEAAEWLDGSTLLIGGGDWDDLRPTLYRVDVVRDVIDVFRGPRQESERRADIHAAVRQLWEDRYPWIDWGDAPE